MRSIIALLLAFFAIPAVAQLGPPPIIAVQPIGISVLKKDTALFTVVVVSLTSTTYQWYKDGDKINGATSAILTLNNVGNGEAGSYKVQVKNSSGSVMSSSATLIVLSSQTLFSIPKCVKKATGFQLMATNITSSTCVVYASQNLITWTPIATNTVVNGGTSYTDSAATNLAFRYYKVCDQ